MPPTPVPRNPAVLFLHGILGRPEQFADFLPLVPEGCSVYCPVLKGHGGSVADFSSATTADWKQQVSDLLDVLSARHTHILVAAHSAPCLPCREPCIPRPFAVSFCWMFR